MGHRTILRAAALVAIGCARVASATGARADDLVGTSIGSGFLLDPSFGDAGSARMPCDGVTYNAPMRIVRDATGYSLLGSHVTYLGAGYEQFVVVRLNADGTLNSSFGEGGCLVTWPPLDVVSDTAVGDDGRYYAAGALTQANDAPIAAVACFEADGARCAGFGPYDGLADVDGFDLRQLPRLLFRDGSLFLVGAASLSSSGRTDTVLVAKLDAATAALDAQFGTGSPAPGEAIFDLGQFPGGSITTDAAIFDGTRVLVGGAAQSTQQGGTVAYVLALDATDGSADVGFGGNGVATIAFGSGADRVRTKALAVHAAGRIAAAGNADIDGGVGPIRELMLAEFAADGSPSTDFAGGGSTHLTIGHETDVTNLAMRSDGSLVVAMTAKGLLPDDTTDSEEQSVAEFDAVGAGPTSTASIAFDFAIPPAPPYSFATALDIDDADRVVLAGGHFYGKIGGTLISIGVEMTATRFVRDAIFANGFE
jgi:hypothetical protein